MLEDAHAIKKTPEPATENKAAMVLKVIVLLYTLVSIAVIWLYLPTGDDLPFHLQRLDAIAKEFSLGVSPGNFPFRIYTVTLEGYGYGSPLFYGDLPLYPFALLAAAGLSTYRAYQLFLSVIVVATLISLDVMIREVTRTRRTIGYALGMLICLLSTTFYGEVLGSCVGRALVWVFAPLAIAGYHRIVFSKRKGGIGLLVAGVAGAFFSHPLNCVLLLGFLVVILLFTLRSVDAEAVKKILAAAGITALLCAWYVCPMLEQMLSQKFFVSAADAPNGKHVLSDFTVTAFGLFVPSGLRVSLLSRLGIDVPFRLYKTGIASTLVVLACTFAHRMRSEDKWGSFNVGLIAVVGFGIWFQTPLFPHDALQGVIGVFQFPWRVYVFCEMSLGLIVASSFANGGSSGERGAGAAKRNVAAWVIACSVIVTIVISAGYDIRSDVSRHTIEGSAQPIAERSPFTSMDVGSGEYIPAALLRLSPRYATGEGDNAWFDFESYLKDRGTNAIAENRGASFGATHDGRRTVAAYSNLENGEKLEMPLLYYVGYSAVDLNTGASLEVSESDNGFVDVRTEASSGTIAVEYTGTLIQHVTLAMSVITLVVLIVTSCLRRK